MRAVPGGELHSAQPPRAGRPGAFPAVRPLPPGALPGGEEYDPIIKIAMLNVYERLNKEGLRAKMVLQVHDELMLDCPLEEQEKASKILKEEMENAVTLKVPLTVEVASGKSWYEAK